MIKAGDRNSATSAGILLLLLLASPPLLAQTTPHGHRQFPIGALRQAGDLPPGRLRAQLEALPEPARERGVRWLRSFHFTESDLPSLHADSEGGILFACSFEKSEAINEAEPPVISGAAVPVSPFPAHLKFHSRPGAPNVLYINFSGQVVTNTQWNTEISRPVIPAVAFSTDSDLTTFNDAEQVAIKRIWQRMAEDYAPFNIDVTTEAPATPTTRTAIALITRTTDANGQLNPFADVAGGVAYVNAFGANNYATYRPAWIYQNNLANDESYIAEAASHEVGHNMGLSHDGRTDGYEYYSGHGSGDTSWGPLMGTGYNRNVSQWSKGEYYLANNTQDDLATIAGKITYRTDDHGGTLGTATALVLSDSTNIVSTTPENDPGRTNTLNKGVLERTTDIDIFSFVTGAGNVRLSVNPWIMPAGTRGNNLDVLAELYNEAGTLLLTNNSASTTTALIQTNLAEGKYYLYVRNSGAGSPSNAAPTGYTAYGSIGQYFLSGYLVEPTVYVAPPTAELQITDLNQPGVAAKQFTVTYTDDVAVNVATIDSNDIRVTSTNGYNQTAQLVSVSSTANGTPRTATYSIPAPNGSVWQAADNGTYTVWLLTNQVADTQGTYAPAGQLGSFRVTAPAVYYSARMDSDPGWTLTGQWQYGTPYYLLFGPTSGYTGTKVIGYNLTGNYGGDLPPTYATTPPINCSGSSSLTLRFMRWLRTRQSDPVTIEASANGGPWQVVWSTSSAVGDLSWQQVQYALPTSVVGSSALRLRWSIASNKNNHDIGWHIDDVEVFGNAVMDTAPPASALSVADLTLSGSPTHSCSVTYTDATAVRLSSLDSTDLYVTGPNGYSNMVEFIGADLPLDGSPVTASYSIAAPGGLWEASDNGTYSLTLVENAVEDTLNNRTAQALLGSFTVAISTETPGVLGVLPAGGLTSTGSVGGPFSPDLIVYTLTNSGGSSLNWTASKSQDWITLSSSSGTLAAHASATVVVSISPTANSLSAGDYSDTVSFINVTTGAGSSARMVSLSIASPADATVTGSVSEGQFQGAVLAQPFKTYVIEASTNFSHWIGIETNTADSSGIVIFSDPAGAPERFYRSRAQP